MQKDDRTLLNRFAADRNEKDFHQLSRRYMGLIFHAALRRTGSRQLAEEASQNVLCALAKKAASLAKQPGRLPAWLHRATLYESSKIMRSEKAHQRRARLEHPDDIPTTATEEGANWSEIIPHLDLALDRLSDSERTIIFQHYFENKTFPKIAEIRAQPSATVQKQCRRAIGKLARTLRGKGVVLSSTTLATAIGAECAKAAPAAVIQSVTAQTLSTYSTFQISKLTLFMTSKSKAFIPAVALIAASPLVFQQVVISQASTQLEDIRVSGEKGRDRPASSMRSSRRTSGSLDSSLGSGSVSRSSIVTIQDLQLALEEAHTGGAIKWIELDQLVSSLDAEQLAGLIPQSLKLQRPISHNAHLSDNLIRALGEIDPERAVRLTFASDSQGRRTALPDIFSQWALIDPDTAFSFYLELENNPSLNQTSEQGYISSDRISYYREALIGPLIRLNSPRASELILKADPTTRGQIVRNAIKEVRGGSGLNASYSTPVPWNQRGYENFIPLIREFVPEKDLEKTYTALLESSSGLAPPTTEEADWLIVHGNLEPAEKELVAKVGLKRIASNFYSHTHLSQLDSRVAETTQWLEQYLPESSEGLVAEAMQRAYDGEMYKARNKLKRIKSDPDIRQADLISNLSQNFFGEHLPEAQVLAETIKDPEKRAEVIEKLKQQEGY